ncbi:hypothetical protein O5O45_02335 [Hahella aquimaris]|uniref:hypothetical protein n=1 Tax=Hahella sp. HNIBRBA332 TaxID=3015983 RepID=UPI00273BE81E|nr:hypothetical protein [Hahella sp. HNIBRBA332]WLQ14774.1 hypothetical protein O5O45_02335 [Hahella sp. HNIBRBA332]
MNAIHNMLSAYGRSMGVNGVGDGVTALSYETGERITLDQRDDCLAVSLSYELPEFEVDEVAEKLLQLTHYQTSTDYQIQPGLMGEGRLVMTICMSASEASIDFLDGAIRRLRYRYQELTGKLGNL